MLELADRILPVAETLEDVFKRFMKANDPLAEPVVDYGDGNDLIELQEQYLEEEINAILEEISTAPMTAGSFSDYSTSNIDVKVEEERASCDRSPTDSPLTAIKDDFLEAESSSCSDNDKEDTSLPNAKLFNSVGSPMEDINKQLIGCADGIGTVLEANEVVLGRQETIQNASDVSVNIRPNGNRSQQLYKDFYAPRRQPFIRNPFHSLIDPRRQYVYPALCPFIGSSEDMFRFPIISAPQESIPYILNPPLAPESQQIQCHNARYLASPRCQDSSSGDVVNGTKSFAKIMGWRIKEEDEKGEEALCKDQGDMKINTSPVSNMACPSTVDLPTPVKSGKLIAVDYFKDESGPKYNCKDEMKPGPLTSQNVMHSYDNQDRLRQCQWERYMKNQCKDFTLNSDAAHNRISKEDNVLKISTSPVAVDDPLIKDDSHCSVNENCRENNDSKEYSLANLKRQGNYIQDQFTEIKDNPKRQGNYLQEQFAEIGEIPVELSQRKKRRLLPLCGMNFNVEDVSIEVEHGKMNNIPVEEMKFIVKPDGNCEIPGSKRSTILGAYSRQLTEKLKCSAKGRGKNTKFQGELIQRTGLFRKTEHVVTSYNIHSAQCPVSANRQEDSQILNKKTNIIFNTSKEKPNKKAGRMMNPSRLRLQPNIKKNKRVSTDNRQILPKTDNCEILPK